MPVKDESFVIVSPHMVVFLEKRIVLHGSLLKLHVDAATVYRDHLLDSAETQSKGSVDIGQ